ncbi:XTP/dITP diphosphatase [Brevibacillus fluminis]|uniref:dITP/XTP pyrophosphatase n=1 Tax=Brevibacillus fluminis TaxID=511487 RepID=A0A3M8DSR0_9BACL|nr:XTP/dITP diphosphatase [Brevibacillus fluminis]RNB90519.1 XTP/dITP diphosphatase [Brevibacillus fluminis]
MPSQANEKKVVLATRNQGKVKEFNKMFAELGYTAVSLADFPDAPDVVEDGDTFEANAVKKAVETASFLGCAVLADDSGLEVDALNGAPGVYSARYAGEHGNDEANWRKLLAELEGVPDEKRTARFRCTLAYVAPGEAPVIATGTCEGMIAHEPKGTNGFGYDPVFYLPERGCMMAEIDPATKNQISHRAAAMHKLMQIFRGE